MLPDTHDRSTQFLFFDDFTKLDTSQFASTDDAGTGTNTILDKRGGWMGVVSAGADNDYHLMSTFKKLFKFEKASPLKFEAKVNLTEAATNVANAVVGLSDTLTTGFMQDNGAGPPANYKGFVFFKVDGGSVWQFETSNGAVQTTNTNVGAVVSGGDITFGIQVEAAPDGINAKVTPFVNGNALAPHLVAISGLAEMAGIFGVKAGSASAETLTIDYFGVHQPR